MPKLITVVALGLALFAAPAIAQDETPAPDVEASAEPPPAEVSAPATQPAAEPQASDLAAPATQPSGAEASDVDVSAPATPPAAEPPAGDVSAPATQPAAVPDEDEEVDGLDDAASPGADAGGGTLLPASTTPPEVMERRLVAYVSTGVAAVALGAGITLGTLALNRYSCLSDVLACNQGLEQPIVGEAFLDQKAEIETLSLLADMAYVVAAAATIVAVTGYIRGYFLTEEDGAAEVTP